MIDYEWLSNVKRLFGAVVLQAVEDYRQALVDQHYAYKLEKEREMRIADIEVERLENFFTGGGCTVFTNLDGPVLMDRVKQQVIEYNYDLKTLKRTLRQYIYNFA